MVFSVIYLKSDIETENPEQPIWFYWGKRIGKSLKKKKKQILLMLYTPTYSLNFIYKAMCHV